MDHELRIELVDFFKHGSVVNHPNGMLIQGRAHCPKGWLNQQIKLMANCRDLPGDRPTDGTPMDTNQQPEI